MNGPFPQSAQAGETIETLSTNGVVYTTPTENFRLNSKIEIQAIPSFSTIAACSSGNSDISCPPAGFTPNQLDLVYDCKGYSSANPAGGWVLDTTRAGHDPVCWQDLRVCYYQGTINELCYEMGTQTIGDTNMQSVNHTEACSIADPKKKYCVTNYDGSNTVKGDTGDDMFKILPNANSFMTYKRPGDTDLELRYLKRNPGFTHDSMELMLPSGPFTSFADYRRFLNNPPDYMTIEGACHPTTVRLCEGTVPPPPVINGACGDAAYGGFYSSPPSGGAGGVATTTLCYSGTPSAVTGSGPYEWTCNGLNGGASSPVCSAAPTVIAQCGSSDGGNFYSAPLSGYCNVGNPSPLSGSGPWTWYCRGAPSPANDDTCTANLIQDGDCGPADGNAYSTAAQVNAAGLCNTVHGSTPSSVSGTGPWSWSCNGTPGGASDSCSARFAPSCPVPPTGGENGTCGSAHGNSFASLAALNASQLCLTGNLAAAASGSPNATWTCNGIGAGSSPQSCNATIASGPCATSGTVHTTNNGCTNAGFTSLEDTSYEEVTGPHWSSSGFGAFITQGGYCLQVMPPANSAPLTFNVYRLYAAPSCTPVAGACGPANGTTVASAPAASTRCASGQTSFSFAGSGPWTWGCRGQNGGADTSATACSANRTPTPVAGACGSAHNTTVSSAPAASTRCASGQTNFSFAGSGPWTWGCRGQYGGADTSATACSANPTTSCITPSSQPNTEVCQGGYVWKSGSWQVYQSGIGIPSPAPNYPPPSGGPVTGASSTNLIAAGTQTSYSGNQVKDIYYADQYDFISGTLSPYYGCYITSAPSCGSANGQTYSSGPIDADELCGPGNRAYNYPNDPFGQSGAGNDRPDIDNTPTQFNWSCLGSGGNGTSCSASRCTPSIVTSSYCNNVVKPAFGASSVPLYGVNSSMFPPTVSFVQNLVPGTFFNQSWYNPNWTSATNQLATGDWCRFGTMNYNGYLYDCYVKVDPVTGAFEIGPNKGFCEENFYNTGGPP